VIFATGFPIVNIRGLYAFKMYKSFSYAVCVPNEAKLGAIYNSVAMDGLTYRDSPDGLIVGGLDHRTGRWKCGEYFAILEEHAKMIARRATTPSALSRVHPSIEEGNLPRTSYKQTQAESARISRRRPSFMEGWHGESRDGVVSAGDVWSANDCMTFDHIPLSGRMFRLFHRNAYIISGFNKNGMTNSFICAQIVADVINKRKNKFRRLLKPTRTLNISVWGSFLKNFVFDGFGLVAGLFSLGKRRCPHMGCRLKFNPNTKTWDCPCHGTRLTSKGDIIVSPTVDINDKL